MSENLKEDYEKSLQKVEDLAEKGIPMKECVEPSLPKELTFRGVRAVVMDAVWKKGDELEAKGIPLTNETFRDVCKEEWQVMKKEIIPAKIKEYEAKKRVYEACERLREKFSPEELAEAARATREVADLKVIAEGIAEEEEKDLVDLGVVKEAAAES